MHAPIGRSDRQVDWIYSSELLEMGSRKEKNMALRLLSICFHSKCPESPERITAFFTSILGSKTPSKWVPTFRDSSEVSGVRFLGRPHDRFYARYARNRPRALLLECGCRKHRFLDDSLKGHHIDFWRSNMGYRYRVAMPEISSNRVPN